MTKRSSVGLIYFIVALMTLLLRVTGSIGIYDALGVDADMYFTLVVQLLIFGALPLIAYFLFAQKQNGGKFLDNIKAECSDFGCKKVSSKNIVRTIVIAICMIFIAGVVSFVWQTILSIIGYKSVSTPIDFSSIGVLFSELFFVAVLPGVFEEVTHRGLLFAGYRETGWKFVLVSALLFSLMHQNITQTGYTFFDGVVIALVMYYTRSIYPSIFIHLLNNTVATVESYVAQNGGFLSFITVVQEWFESSIWGYLAFIAIAIVLFILMVFMFKRMRDDSVKNNYIPKQFFDKGDANALPLHKDIFLWATIFVGVSATIFSLVWGIMR
ncbi:MAG: CPBP family intramembrane glutamic endopeptidase [Clostridia bacterium]